MIIHSDWHMHSEASYDSKLPISEIEKKSLSAKQEADRAEGKRIYFASRR